MFTDWLRKIVGPSMFLAILATIWVEAWSRSVEAEADRGYWPPLPAMQADAAANNSATDSTAAKP
jgi:hypothetical protein